MAIACLLGIQLDTWLLLVCGGGSRGGRGLVRIANFAAKPFVLHLYTFSFAWHADAWRLLLIPGGGTALQTKKLGRRAWKDASFRLEAARSLAAA